MSEEIANYKIALARARTKNRILHDSLQRTISILIAICGDLKNTIQVDEYWLTDKPQVNEDDGYE